MPSQGFPPFVPAASVAAGGRAFRRSAILVPFLLGAIVLDLPPVVSWGATGHEVVANVAWRLLSNETRNSIELILGTTTVTLPEATLSSSACPDCSPLALVADWADQARYTSEYHWTAPLHYIDIRDDLIDGACPAGSSNEATRSPLCTFNYTRDCVNDFCVAGAIANYTRQLHPSSGKAPPPPKGDNENDDNNSPAAAVALKFVVHFVGDIHQPLHCSRTTDRGGNSIDVHWEFPSVDAAAAEARLPPPPPPVVWVESFHLRNRFYRKVPQRRAATVTVMHPNPLSRRRHYHGSVDNLHAVWDDGLIEAVLSDDFGTSRTALEDWLVEYVGKTAANVNRTHWNAWVACANGANLECTAQWAQESWDDALRWAYRDSTNDEVCNGETLSREYYRSRLPVVYERLAVAGVRLAATLTKALPASAAATMDLDQP